MFDDPPGPFPLGLRTLTTSDPYQLSRSPELGRSPFGERSSRALLDPAGAHGELNASSPPGYQPNRV